MMENFLNIGPFMGPRSFGMILALVWSLAWKGLALWRAARRGENVWFVALLVINTMGILEILYIYVFSKDKAEPAGEEGKK